MVSIKDALRELRARPVHTAFRDLLNPGFLEWIASSDDPARPASLSEEAGRQVEDKSRALAKALNDETSPDILSETAAAVTIRRLFEAILRLPAPSEPEAGLEAVPLTARLARPALFGWAVLRTLGPARIKGWSLEGILADNLRDAAGDDFTARQTALALRALAERTDWFRPGRPADENARRLTALVTTDPAFRGALLVNEHQGVEYYHKESFERLLWWAEAAAAAERPASEAAEAGRAIELLRDAGHRSGFKLSRLIAALA